MKNIKKGMLIARIDNIENNISILAEKAKALREELSGTALELFTPELAEKLQRQDRSLKNITNVIEVVTVQLYTSPFRSK